ncbi:MAG: NAD-dependent deacetylase [Firmicutes bacterium]|nr:NAD-dependent deacetylase [Bacillota bacterium]
MDSDVHLLKSFQEAAKAIREANTLVITAGAGIGVDSGLPDYRGDKGFWKSYPMYESLGINYYDAANPVHFSDDPAFGWGFYAHRIDLYRRTVPHHGFRLLQGWIKKGEKDYFVVTSNVDGQFQKAGFPEDKIYEIHGSIHHLQCCTPCSEDVWENTDYIAVDLTTMRAEKVLRCSRCGNISRPNVLMFGDFSWVGNRSDMQRNNYHAFLKECRFPVVVVEMGAGKAISTIRHMSEGLGASHKALVVRINPRDYHISPPHISIPCGALKGLQGIDEQFSFFV